MKVQLNLRLLTRRRDSLRSCCSARANSGFAIVIALSLMAFILLLLLSMIAMSKVQIATSETHETKVKAEQNALLGLQVALGNLQKQLGRDQRLSASAQMLDKSLADTSPLARWTGAWDTAEFNEDGSLNPNYGRHLGWLISGYDRDADAGVVPGIGNPVAPDGSVADPDNDVLLVGPGSVDDTAVSDYVAARKVAGGRNGQYAYWVSDEGRKARINLASRLDMGDALYPGSTDEVEGRFALSSPMRMGAQILPGFEDFEVESDTTVARNIFRSSSASDLALSHPSFDGNSVSAWDAPAKAHYHSISYHSVSLQTDVRQGGLKRDLSLLFELDDADFARTPFSGDPSSSSVFNEWTRVPENDDSIAHPYVDPVHNDGVSYLFKERITRARYAGQQAYVRGPTWHYLRDYYRLYQDVSDSTTQPEIEMRPFGPNASHFTGDAGQQGLIATWESDQAGDISATEPKIDSYVNTVIGNAHTGNDEPVTRLTKHEVLPVLNRVIFRYSLYNDESVQKYKFEPQYDTDGNIEDKNAFVADGGTTDAVALVVEPFVYLWNPYNVAIQFTGAYKIHADSSVFGLMISIAPPGSNIKPDLSDADYAVKQMTGYLGGYGRITDSQFSKLDLVVGGTGTIRMEPGEVVVFSDPNNTPTPMDALPRVNTEHGSLRAPMLRLGPGVSETGGVLVGRRNHTHKESLTQDGIFHQIETNDPTQLEVNVYNWGLNGFAPISQDRSGSASRSFNLQCAYIPPGAALSSGGSLYTTDTYLQRLYATVYGPDFGASPLRELLYESEFPLVTSGQAVGQLGKIQLFSIGLYQNPVVTEPGVATTSEFIGTMSPFAPLLDPQFSNFAMASPPYSVQMRADDLDIQYAYGTRNGYFGDGYGPDVTHLVVSEIPTYPLRSLGSLQHARISHSAYMPGQAIGNSWASGFMDLDEAHMTQGDGRYSMYDISYLSNRALFDTYYFSSITPQLDFNTAQINEVADLEETLSAIATTALNEGKSPAIANERFVYVGDAEELGDGSASSEFVRDLSGLDGFGKSAKYFGVKGGFNVNSLSVDNWKAFLASTLGQDYAVYAPGSSISSENNTNLTIFPRTTLPNGDSSDEWLGPKGLTPVELSELAEHLVEQVRARGPFLCLADFVNRALDNSDLGRKGAIQSAIDALGVNSSQEYIDAYTRGISSGAFDISNVTAKSGVGVPQYLTQADVLTPMAPYLSVRSDTFVIRSYGEVEDPLTGEVISKVWCEALVQRFPDFVDTSDDADVEMKNLSSENNRQMGRKFRVVSFRWLNEDEV